MTELGLQQEIENVLKKEILPEISIFGKNEMKVFKQDIPLSSEFEGEDDKYFPCCIVAYRESETKTASDPQQTTIEIIICIKDWSEDMSGYQNLMIVLDRISNYFVSHVGIPGKYRLVYPIKKAINEEAAMPYFIGSLKTQWQTDLPHFVDCNEISKFL